MLYNPVAYWLSSSFEPISCSMSRAMDDSAVESVDEPRGVAFGKFCLWEDVSDRFSQIIKHLLIPPVEELLGVR